MDAVTEWARAQDRVVEPEDHNSTWTQRQVDARAGRDIAALTGEWLSLTGPMRDWMRERGPRPRCAT